MANLLIVCGLPGTGKSTTAKVIAAKIKGVLLRTDVIRREVGLRRYSDEEMQKVYSEMLSRAKKMLLSGRHVVLDATFSKRKNRQAVRKLVESLGADFKIVEVVCPEKLIKERMAQRKGDASEARFKHYLERKKDFEPIKAKHLVIDTSRDIGRQLVERF